MPPLQTGVSALQLDPAYADAEQAAQRINPGQVAPAPVAQAPVARASPTSTPAALTGSAPAAQPTGAPKSYNPEEALKSYLQKRFPDMEPEHWDFAKRLLKAKIEHEHFKSLGKEHRSLLNEYWHQSYPFENTKLELDALVAEDKEAQKKYDEAIKSGKNVAGLANPAEDEKRLGRLEALKHKLLAHDARRADAWKALSQHYEKMTGRHLQDEPMSRMGTRLLTLPAGIDPTEDLMDEHAKEQQTR